MVDKNLIDLLREAGFTVRGIHYPDTNPYPRGPDTNPYPERRWPFPGTGTPPPKSPPVVEKEKNAAVVKNTFNCVLLQDAESYTLKAYLAGVDKNSISINVGHNSLLISAQSRPQQPAESCLMDEQPKSFSRAVVIPEDADFSAAAPANYVDGVLIVVIPRKIALKESIPVA